MDTDKQIEALADYYARRANEYEEIYYRQDPQRQKEQAAIRTRIQETLKGADVLELACGTGYWTQFVSETAEKITATDFNEEVLELAKLKHYACPVSFEKVDAYHLPFPPGTFGGGLANFWFSHVPKHRIEYFLSGFHKTLKAGSTVFIADNMHVAGVGGDLIRKQGDDNTYKLRTLKDGTQQEVLKNYFSKEELFQIFRKYDPAFAEDDIVIGSCFWLIKYRI